MTENKIKYLLGIDGGGTKTEFLLTDLNRNEINRITLGASNPVNIGIDNTKAVLSEGITRICSNFDLKEVSVFAGLAGGKSEDIKVMIHKFLSDIGFGAYDCGCDTDSALEIALKGNNGVAVIMGTGIIAFSSLDGIRHRIGGRGYLIDKGGSGFCIGADALDCAFKALDGRGGSKIILQLVEEKLQKPLCDSTTDIYSGGASFVASFAPAVFDAYKKDDPCAEKIIDRNVKEAAQIIKTGCDYSKNKSAVICGGLCRRKDILMPFFKKYLDSEYKLIFSEEPMVNGAVSLAKKLAEEKHA